jgi:hypothetical protein
MGCVILIPVIESREQHAETQLAILRSHMLLWNTCKHRLCTCVFLECHFPSRTDCIDCWYTDTSAHDSVLSWNCWGFTVGWSPIHGVVSLAWLRTGHEDRSRTVAAHKKFQIPILSAWCWPLWAARWLYRTCNLSCPKQNYILLYIGGTGWCEVWWLSVARHFDVIWQAHQRYARSGVWSRT